MTSLKSLRGQGAFGGSAELRSEKYVRNVFQTRHTSGGGGEDEEWGWGWDLDVGRAVRGGGSCTTPKLSSNFRIKQQKGSVGAVRYRGVEWCGVGRGGKQWKKMSEREGKGEKCRRNTGSHKKIIPSGVGGAQEMERPRHYEGGRTNKKKVLQDLGSS